MSDFREIQIMKYLNLISCEEISKPYLNDKYFLKSILNSQKVNTEIFELDIRVPTYLLIDDRGFISLSFKGHSLSQKKTCCLSPALKWERNLKFRIIQ